MKQTLRIATLENSNFLLCLDKKMVIKFILMFLSEWAKRADPIPVLHTPDQFGSITFTPLTPLLLLRLRFSCPGLNVVKL